MTAAHSLRDLLRDPIYLRVWLIGGFSARAISPPSAIPT